MASRPAPEMLVSACSRSLALAWKAILRSAKAGSTTLFLRRTYAPARPEAKKFLASYFSPLSVSGAFINP